MCAFGHGVCAYGHSFFFGHVVCSQATSQRAPPMPCATACMGAAVRSLLPFTSLSGTGACSLYCHGDYQLRCHGDQLAVLVPIGYRDPCSVTAVPSSWLVSRLHDNLASIAYESAICICIAYPIYMYMHSSHAQHWAGRRPSGQPQWQALLRGDHGCIRVPG